MRQFSNRFFLVVSILLIFLLSGCSDDFSKIRLIYKAEKMFYKASKIKSNILINPDIASPDEYKKTQQAYTNIILDLGNKAKEVKEIKDIVRRSWLEVANLSLMQKNYDEAIKRYQEIIFKSPEDKELCAVAQFSIASTYENTNNIDAAIEAYQRIVENYSPVLSDTLLPNYRIIQTPLYIARLYKQKGEHTRAFQQYNKAREYYLNIINKWPGSKMAFAAHDQIAVSFGDQDEWAKAANVLNEILSIYSNTEDLFAAQFTLSNIYATHLNQSGRALEILNRIVYKYPENERLSRVYLAKGEIYNSQRKFEQARVEFVKVLENYRQNANACIRAQLSIAKGYEIENNWDKALNEYQWLVNNYPKSRESVEIPIYIAEYYKSKNENERAHDAYEDAINKYEQIIETYPGTMLSAMSLDFKSKCHLRLEQWEQASQTIEQLLENNMPPQLQVASYLTLGSLYEEKIYNPEKAINAYNKILQNYPDIPFAEDLQTKTRNLKASLANYEKTNTAPASSAIIEAKQVSNNSMEIVWNQNRESDFSCYQLFRSDAPGVNSNDKLITEIKDARNNSFLDSGLEKGKNYYYRLYVCDNGGLSTGSAEFSGKILSAQLIANIRLSGRSENWSEAQLTWNKINVKGFDCYKIYRSTRANVSQSSTLVKSIFSNNTIQFQDDNLNSRSDYFYKVFVYNKDGQFEESNEIQISTLDNTPPGRIILNQPLVKGNNAIELSWTPNNDSDFSMYRLYRSETSPVTTTRTPLWMSSNRSITNYRDDGLRRGKTYHYKIIVFDKGQKSTESNEVTIKY